jgi:hypothetical protein
MVAGSMDYGESFGWIGGSGEGKGLIEIGENSDE